MPAAREHGDDELNGALDAAVEALGAHDGVATSPALMQNILERLENPDEPDEDRARPEG